METKANKFPGHLPHTKSTNVLLDFACFPPFVTFSVRFMWRYQPIFKPICFSSVKPENVATPAAAAELFAPEAHARGLAQNKREAEQALAQAKPEKGRTNARCDCKR